MDIPKEITHDNFGPLLEALAAGGATPPVWAEAAVTVVVPKVEMHEPLVEEAICGGRSYVVEGAYASVRRTLADALRVLEEVLPPGIGRILTGAEG